VNHPECCTNPDTCQLSYVDHLRGFALTAAAVPSRAVTRNPGLPDEPAARTLAREKRWERDLPAHKRLRESGHQAPLNGAAQYERSLG